MISKIYEDNSVQTLPFHFLGDSAHFEGSLMIKGDLRINGVFKGEIIVEDEGEVIIEENGSFTGHLKAHHVTIMGKADGVIHARGKLTVRPSGHFEGEISCKDLVIFPGAHLKSKNKTLDN
jgi:cytoskeletal protein CcmA (bactofilin family)